MVQSYHPKADESWHGTPTNLLSSHEAHQTVLIGFKAGMVADPCLVHHLFMKQ
jgi:hypothetical protein